MATRRKYQHRDRLGKDLLRVVEGRLGAETFVEYAVRLVELSRPSFESFRSQTHTITAARKYFRLVERQAAALASTLQRGDRRFGLMHHNAHKLAGGSIERSAPDIYEFEPARRVGEIRKAATLVVRDCDRAKGKRPVSIYTVERLGYLATAYEHFLRRRPGQSANSMFYRLAVIVMDNLGLPASDIRAHLKAALKSRPAEIVRFSEP